MALPDGLTTYTLRFGPIDGFLPENLSCDVTITANMPVIWNPTGQTIANYPETKTFTGSTSSVLFNLPSDADTRIVDSYGVPVVGRLQYLIEWRIYNSENFTLSYGTKWSVYSSNMSNPQQVLLA